MFSTTFLSIKTKLALVLACVALSASFFLVQAPQAAAQVRPGASMTELQIMLQTLLAQIAALTSGENVNIAEYEAGDKIITTDSVNVRATGSTAGQIIGVQRADSLGTISDVEPVNVGNYTWYRVNFDTGVDGWVASINFANADLDDEEETSLNFSISDSNPESMKIFTDENELTQETTLVYEIEADGNTMDTEEIEIETLVVGVKVLGAVFESVIDDMYLKLDGQVFDDVRFSTVGNITTATFDIDSDISIMLNREVEVEVVVNFEEGADKFTVETFVSELERNATRSDSATLTGMALGNVHTVLLKESIVVDQTSVRANAEGENGEIGDYTIEFDVIAADQDIYIKAIATQAPKGGGLTYKVEGPNSDSATAMLSSDAPMSNEYYIVREGEKESFEANVRIKSTIAGNFRVGLETLNYLYSPTGLPITQNLLPVSDFRTNFVFLTGSKTPVVGKINSFTASPTSVPQVKNGQQEVTLRWSSTGTGLCAIFESIKGNDLLKLTSNQKSSGSFVVKPIWNKSSQYGPRGYVIRCSNSITDKFVEASVFVKLEDVITPTVKPTPRFNGLSYPVDTPTVKVSAVFGTVRSGQAVVAGPTTIGSIDWGDGSPVEKVTALITGDQITVDRSYTYRKNGTFIIKLTNPDGKIAEQKVVVTKAIKLVMPLKNNFACDRAVTTKLAANALACYGMWDYGDDFGGDAFVCQDKNTTDIKGCVIKTPICSSGSAKATAYFTNASLSSTQILTISSLLKTSVDAVKQGVAGLWEYRCLASTVVVPPVDTPVTTTYTLTDILSVTKKVVDPNKTAIDDEYTLYTITLKDKKTHLIKVFGNQKTTVRDTNIKKTGYTGDIPKLLALAKTVAPLPISDPKRPTASTTPIVKGAATDIYAEISETLRNISDMLKEQK